MQAPVHSINELFQQLGLPSSDTAIERFIESHKPVASTQGVGDLDCFSPSQRQFLDESRAEDADWAEVIDTLDSLMHQEADIRPS